ncbi:MAG: UDP-N-acetylmuramate--L-alanine ligase [Myxococcaceae bacterium]|nr:UDP-N-acetylmuramate--L-alanine ligase [Myxococcaceae bacterium]
MVTVKDRRARVHFVGIGGIGMSGIAEVLLNLGYQVTGSDLRASDVTRHLESLGATVHCGPHRAENLGPCDVVVISSAVRRDNPEVTLAREFKIPVIPRAEMLAELMRIKFGVAVAGSHGKTTTTSIIATVLSAAGLDPTTVVGGKVNSLGSNARLGKSDLMVVEADESDGSFLKLTPALAVVTNIDPEHLDHYGSLERLRAAFLEFVNRVPFYGLAAICLDHPNVQALIPDIEKRFVTYGFSAQADYRATDVRLDGHRTVFQAFRRTEPLGEFALPMVGRHNAQNALAAIAIADELGVDMASIRASLAEFGGVQRRFTVRGEERGVLVVDDYGQHPSEIRATLAGAKQAFGRRLIVAFEPHRYSRTQLLMDDLATAFNDADVLFLTEVYAASESPIPGADGASLAEAIRARGHRDVTFIPSRADLAQAIADRAFPGDLVLTLGAGSITRTGPELLERLRQERGSNDA